MKSLSVILVAFCLIHYAKAHGYMLDPPARSTAWRKGFSSQINYDDNALRCGGTHLTRTGYEDKCGVCGDGLGKLENEPGKDNKYAQGIIVASYTQGQAIDVTIRITAFHLGIFEFRLCDNDIPQLGTDSTIAVNQTCFSANLLKSSVTDRNWFVAKQGTEKYSVQLPKDVVCKACVLQWRYHTGNSWGTETYAGKSRTGLGWGPQENFIGCADISIEANEHSDRDSDVESHTTTESNTTTESHYPFITDSIPEESTSDWEEEEQDENNDDQNEDSTNDGRNGDNSRPACRPTRIYQRIPGMDTWCDHYCNHVWSYCPSTHCVCD